MHGPQEFLHNHSSKNVNIESNIITDQNQDDVEEMMMNQIFDGNYGIQNQQMRKQQSTPLKLEAQRFNISTANKGNLRKTAIGNVYIPDSIPVTGIRVK